MSLLRAIYENNCSNVRKAIESQPQSVFEVDGSDLTPLHVAAAQGSSDVVKLLLETEAGLDSISKDGATPLILACENQHIDAVSLLLKAGADKNMQTVDGRSPLHVVCALGNVDIVSLLLSLGVNDSLCDASGATALHLACKKDRLEVVELLAGNGCDVKFKSTHNGWNGLMHACTIGSMSLCKALLDHGADMNATNMYGDCPVHIVSRVGHVSILQLLIDRGAVLVNDNSSQINALYMACACGHSEIVTLLLASHSYFSKQRDRYFANGITCFLVACQEGHMDIIDILLANGYDVTSSSKINNFTGLHMASRKGHTATAKKLIHAGADINAVDNLGRSALHLACLKGNAEIARCLFENGISTNVRDKAGRTALHMAAQLGFVELVKLFINFEVDLDVQIYDGLDLAHYSLRMFFVMFYCVVCCDPSKASVSSVTVSGNTGYTALHESCIRGEIEVACILADAGAKMDTVLKDGRTPLDCLLEQSDKDTLWNTHLAAKAREKQMRLQMERDANAKAHAGQQYNSIEGIILQSAVDSVDGDNDKEDLRAGDEVEGEQVVKEITQPLSSAVEIEMKMVHNLLSVVDGETSALEIAPQMLLKWTNNFDIQSISSVQIQNMFGGSYFCSMNWLGAESNLCGVILKQLRNPISPVHMLESKSTSNPAAAAQLLSRRQRHRKDTDFKIRREALALNKLRHPNICCLLGFTIPPPVESLTQAALTMGSTMKKNTYSFLSPSTEIESSVNCFSSVCFIYESPQNSLGILDTLLNEPLVEISWRQRLKIMTGLASSLHYMHNHNPSRPTLHGDVKCTNIIILDNYCPKLMDCGLSKYVNDSSKGASIDGLTMPDWTENGDDVYMHPELLKGSITYDVRCEAYSYGLILLQLITWTSKGWNRRADVNVHVQITEYVTSLRQSDTGGVWNVDAYNILLDLVLFCLSWKPKLSDRNPFSSIFRKLKTVFLLFCKIPDDIAAGKAVSSGDDGTVMERFLALYGDLEGSGPSDGVSPAKRAQHVSASPRRICTVCCDTVSTVHGIECRGGVGMNNHFTCNHCFTDYVTQHIVKKGCAATSCGDQNAYQLSAEDIKLKCQMCSQSSKQTFYSSYAVVNHVYDTEICAAINVIIEQLDNPIALHVEVE